jgi:hypothetical protein
MQASPQALLLGRSCSSAAAHGTCRPLSLACMAGSNGAHVQTAAVVGQQEQADSSDAVDSTGIGSGAGAAPTAAHTARRTRRRGAAAAAAAASSSTAFSSLSCNLQGPASALQGHSLPAAPRHSSAAGNLQGGSSQGYAAEYFNQDLTDGPDPWLLQPAVPAGLVQSPADRLSDLPSHIAIRLQPNGSSSSSSSHSHNSVGSWVPSNSSLLSTASSLHLEQPAPLGQPSYSNDVEGGSGVGDALAARLGKAITNALSSCQTWHDVLGLLQSIAATPDLAQLPPHQQQQLLQQRQQQQPGLHQDARAAGLLAVPQVQQLEAPSLECLNHRNLAVLWLTLARVLPSENSSRHRSSGGYPSSRVSGSPDSGYASTSHSSAGPEPDVTGSRKQVFASQALGRGDVLILQRLLSQLEQRSLVSIHEGAWDSKDLATVQWAMANVGHVPSSR